MNKSEYAQFVKSIPELLETLQDRIQASFDSFELNYKESNNLIFGEYLLANQENLEEDDLMISLKAYIGECWKFHFSGEWALNTQKTTYCNKEPIIFWGNDSTPAKCPQQVIDNLIEKKRADWLVHSINHSKEIGEKLDDLFDELGW